MLMMLNEQLAGQNVTILSRKYLPGKRLGELGKWVKEDTLEVATLFMFFDGYDVYDDTSVPLEFALIMKDNGEMDSVPADLISFQNPERIKEILKMREGIILKGGWNCL